MMGNRSGRTLSKGGEVCTCTTTTSVVRVPGTNVWYSGTYVCMYVRIVQHVCHVCMTCSTRVVHGTSGVHVCVHTCVHTVQVVPCNYFSIGSFRMVQ
jgi:hypothetical protein